MKGDRNMDEHLPDEMAKIGEEQKPCLSERYIIDRIEGDQALLQSADGAILAVDLSELPEPAHEGQVWLQMESGWQADAVAETERKAALKQRLMRLAKRN